MMVTPRADRLLPTGTVTFLFTDIEGSTRLWATHRAAMQQALAHHDAIMRDAIESNDGYIVKTTQVMVCLRHLRSRRMRWQRVSPRSAH